MKRLYTMITAVLAILAVTAEDPQPAASITETINLSGVITVTHPDALERRLSPAQAETQESVPADSIHQTLPASSTGKKSGGYRVQIFSDNNARTAKTEAQTKARAIAEAFPHYATYVVYTSPYWRLKVGDFKTHEEAEMAATEIKRAFPGYAREIRVVKDRINAR